MVNIKFIAEKAGVSLRTVSNVLNNRDSKYSKDTKKGLEHNRKVSIQA